MTADSGKRFTCIIPQSDGKINIEKQKAAQQAAEQPLSSGKKQEKPKNSENESEDSDAEVSSTAARKKSTEELMKEVDTLDNRDRYIQEYMIHASNLEASDTKKKRSKHKRSSCYYSREGYWNYELCLYDRIRQYHGPKHKRDPQMKLGDFAAYIDASKILTNDANYPYLYLKDIYDSSLFEDTEKYFAHLLYIGGDGNRESLVSIQCSTTAASAKLAKDGIIKIAEPKVHHYHFEFIYNAVCDYRTWLQREYGIYVDGLNALAKPFVPSAIDESATSSEQLLYDRNIDPNSDDVSLLLSPLLDLAQNNKCLLLKQGWWTVEFCYGKFIRQIHLEPKKQKNKEGQIVNSVSEWDIKQEHVIGRWPTTQVIAKDSFVIHKNEDDPKRTYASIVYDDGDECDLSRKPRKSEIQFRCGLNIEHSELIKSREDPSCEYIAQVDTPLLCHHPDFKIPSAPSREIVCYPFDEKEFVDDASAMKQAADIQSESDAILKMVRNAARFKHEEKMRQTEQEVVGDGDDDDKIDSLQQKTEL